MLKTLLDINIWKIIEPIKQYNISIYTFFDGKSWDKAIYVLEVFMKNSKKTIDSLLQYKNKECYKMTEDEIGKTSSLFSEHYGIWSLNHSDEKLRGKKVKLSKDKIKEFYVTKPDRYVAMAFIGEELVGHIFYLKRKGEKTGDIIWILQLVVNKEYRGMGIGTKLMHSIWGLSNCYAWGLFTSNPMTIKTLEKATMRKVNQKLIEKKFEKIKAVANDIFDDNSWLKLCPGGTLNTGFSVDHSCIQSKIKKIYKKNQFPLTRELPEGHEWLAFTFKSQEPHIDSVVELDDYLSYSHDIIQNAYSNMNMNSQSWTFHAKEEIEYLCRDYIKQEDKVIDVGCGIGRHTSELNRRNIQTIGVDFSERNIQEAKELYGMNDFFAADITKFKTKDKFDVALALYDVIGSFPDEKQNLRVLNKIWSLLRPKGLIILSVMNMDYSRKKCDNTISSINDDIKRLLKLEGTNTMQKTGDVFCGDCMLIEENTGVVYRKEQFINEDSLPCEYIIRDRRYTQEGICKLLKRAGFSIIETHYFSAKNMSKEIDSEKGKEILVVGQKSTVFFR